MSLSVQSSAARQVSANTKIRGASLRWTDEDICPYVACGAPSARYLCSASCQVGIEIPCFSKLSGDNTEYLGRSAGRTNLSLVVWLTAVSSPERATISRANLNQSAGQIYRVGWGAVLVAHYFQPWPGCREFQNRVGKTFSASAEEP